jgi:hypothetical protein
MGSKTAAEILSGSGEDAVKLKDLVGKTFTIVDFEVRTSRKYDSEFVLIDSINEDGEEFTVMGGGHLAPKLKKLERNGFLPLDVKGVSFPTDKGDGYGIEVAE